MKKMKANRITPARGTIALVLILLLALFVYFYFHNPSSGKGDASAIAYKIKTVRGEASKSTLPYIINYPNIFVMQKVNSQIDEIVKTATCLSDLSDEDLRDSLTSFQRGSLSPTQIAHMDRAQLISTLGWESEVSIDDVYPIYAKNGLFSFVYGYNYDCGGPHPEHGSSGLIFDMKTGTNIGSKDMFKDFDADHDAIRKIFLKAYLAEDKRSGNDPRSSDYDSSCPDAFTSNEEAFDDAEFYVSSTTLIMLPQVIYALGPCGFDVPVSVSALKPYLPSDSPLLKVVQ